MKRDRIRIAALILSCILPVVLLSASCLKKKSDQELILETLNGYLKTQGKGEYEKSYKYLSSQTKGMVSEADWVTTHLRNVNAVRLMREPKLQNIVISGDTATADYHYIGVPTEVLTAALSQMYSKNFHMPQFELNHAAEEYILEHFNEVSKPQMQSLTFVREPSGWKLFLDIKEGASKREGQGNEQ